MLGQDFKEFIALLHAHDVRYLIVGGYAVAAHGYPRYTKDLDIWVDASDENVGRLLAALEDFGFGSMGITREDFLEPESILQLGQPPNRIDLLTSLNAVDFASCHAARVLVNVDGLEMAFIDVEHLIENKSATGRAQDQADAENLR